VTFLPQFFPILQYGINGLALNWFASYLKDRRQKVDIDGHLSTESISNISVIQGSILGPILFLIYINDLYSASNLFKLMFADDTAGLACGDNLPELFNFVDVEIKKIARWFRANKMAVNVGKTKQREISQNLCNDDEYTVPYPRIELFKKKPTLQVAKWMELSNRT
jgi:hypothetical protein